MSLPVGTVVEMTRDDPDNNIVKGDIGIINYEAMSGRYSVHIFEKYNPRIYENGRQYGEDGDYWISVSDVKEYHYKVGDRVEIHNPRSKYNGYHATVCKEYIPYNRNVCVDLYVDGTDYQPEKVFGRQYLTLVKTSVIPLVEDKGENDMKLFGYKNVAVIEIANKDYFYALYDEDITVGDTVLVTGKAPEIYTVKDILTAEEGRERCSVDIIAEVKCKVDLSKYKQRVKNREEAIKLRQKMDAEIKKMDEMNKYEMYADRNPVLKEMLKQFKLLSA